MDLLPLTLVVCLALLIATITPGAECYTEMYIDGTSSLDGQPPQNPYLWFGPRLGRRKRTMDEIPLPRGPAAEETVLGILEDTPWALVPLKSLHDRQGVTPGRMTVREVEEVPDNSKAPPFAPRLGRRRKLLPFSPRLGRDMEPVERFERSVSDDTKHH